MMSFKDFLLAQAKFSFVKRKRCVYAYKFKGKRYDAGDKLGYIKAIIDFALESDDLKNELRSIFKKIEGEQ